MIGKERPASETLWDNWGAVVATALLAVVALAVGVAVFFGVMKLHRL